MVGVGAIAVTLAVLLAVAPLGAAPAWLGGALIAALHGLLAAIGYAIAAGGVGWPEVEEFKLGRRTLPPLSH